MRVLHIIASVDPAGGGPIENSKIVSLQLRKHGVKTTYLSLDQPRDAHLENFPFPVVAAGPDPGKFGRSSIFNAAVEQAVAGADIAIIHGLWNFACVGAHTIIKRADLPYLVFTHGMLDPWFARTYPVKHIGKHLYWLLRQGRVLSSAYRVLFTTEEEKHLAEGSFWGHLWRPEVVKFCSGDQMQFPIGVTPASAQRAFRAQLPALGERPYFLYLSRIHPKKGCDNLIEAFASVAAEHPEFDLVIAGPDYDGWGDKLRAQSAALGVDGRVHWPGMLLGATKTAAFSGAQALVLPSHQENFGLVVAEALSCSTPVLITDKVNIWREVVAGGAGLAAPDTVAGTKQLLRKFLALSPMAEANMRAATRPLFERHFSEESAARSLLTVIEAALGTTDLSPSKAQLIS